MLPQSGEENNVAAVVQLRFTFRVSGPKLEMVTTGIWQRLGERGTLLFGTPEMIRDKTLTRIAAAIFTPGALAFAQSTTGSRADFTRRLVAAAVERRTVHVRYFADYVHFDWKIIGHFRYFGPAALPFSPSPTAR
jgi:hypothetical protein